MNLALKGIGKKFNRSWVFRNVDLVIDRPSCAILGPNGSGKSTLMRIIAGQLEPDEGSLVGFDPKSHFKKVSYCAPYIDLPEEFTFMEILHFHEKFKPMRNDFNAQRIVDNCGLQKSADKTLKSYSSGMKQRVKLALAIFFQSEICLLDEPTSHLDATGVEWYKQQVGEILSETQVIVGSNQKAEYDFCDDQLLLTNFQK